MSRQFHPDTVEDISQGHVIELTEFVMFRVLIPDPSGDVERIKIAVQVQKVSEKTGKLETVCREWSTARNIEDALAKIEGGIVWGLP